MPGIHVSKLPQKKTWMAGDKPGHDEEKTIREDIMPRVALVTGGTRGIGEAICKALQAAGYKVAANYGGNDEAAQKFKAATGIAVYKWDVSNYEACAAGIKKWRPISDRSRCWSTMPALPVTPCSIA